VFYVLADGAGLCTKNDADIVVAFALGNPEENFALRVASILALRLLPSRRVDRSTT
jgi:hypothetical protein